MQDPKPGQDAGQGPVEQPDGRPDRDGGRAAASRYVDLAGGLAWPDAFGQLEPSEQLVLWALRRWITGLADMAENQWTLVCRLLTRRFGKEDGEALVRGLARYLHTICCHPRRTLRYHQPCCPGISGDEIAMLTLLAVAQRGERAELRRLACWLVSNEGAPALAEAALALAAPLATLDQELPRRMVPPAAPAGHRPVLSVVRH